MTNGGKGGKEKEERCVAIEEQRVWKEEEKGKRPMSHSAAGRGMCAVYGGGANTKLFCRILICEVGTAKKGGGTFSRSENDNGGEGRKKVSWFRGGA